MALIICPKCGRQISDKEVSCSGCGYPVSNIKALLNREIDLEDTRGSHIYKSGNTVKVSTKEKVLYEGSVDNFRVVGAGVNFSGQYINFGFPGKIFSIMFYPKSQDDVHLLQQVFSDKFSALKKSEREYLERYKKEEAERKAARKAAKARKRYEALQIKCPKCGSTSWTYVPKRLSIGRAVIGNFFAGDIGAVLGGLSSKKGNAVCLHCGKRWKLK